MVNQTLVGAIREALESDCEISIAKMNYDDRTRLTMRSNGREINYAVQSHKDQNWEHLITETISDLTDTLKKAKDLQP
jgi:trans-2-enoyl-CoA reductase